jgi:hypothetical protein
VASQGLLEGTHLYVVPCALHALHPAFDDVLLGVLAADPRGEVLLLYEEGQGLWLAKLRRRLGAHPLGAPPLLARLRFREERAGTVGQPSSPARRALMAAAEVVLDPFPVGLGLAALEALQGGTPVVSCPPLQAPALRRTGEGALRRLGLGEELLATGVEDFVARAVRVASDAPTRARLAAAIRARAPLLTWRDEWVASANGGNGSSGSSSSSSSSSSGGGSGGGSGVGGEDAAWLAAQAAAGLADPGAGTVHDWLSFLGRAGAPWAVAREATASARGDGMRERRGARRGGGAGAGDGARARAGGAGAGDDAEPRRRRRRRAAT